MVEQLFTASKKAKYIRSNIDLCYGLVLFWLYVVFVGFCFWLFFFLLKVIFGICIRKDSASLLSSVQTPAVYRTVSASESPKCTKDSNKQGFNMTICRGEEGEGSIYNYLVLCRINELHHQVLFLNTFCKEKGGKL